MPHESDRLAAELLHHRSAGLAPGDSLAAPLVAASAFHLPGQPDAPFQYGRFSSPTWEVLEHALGLLEGAETVVFPSGMAATAAVFYAHLRSGDRVLLPSDGYYTTRALIERYLGPMGIATDLRPTAALAEGGFGGYRLVWVETPSNPGLEVCDLARVAEEAHRAGAVVVADNTTMTALGQRPLDLGADLVVASDTKAANGHADVLLGHVSSRDGELLGPVRDWRKLAGAIPGPFEAWLAHRGLATLEVRLERMCANALAIAERLAVHPRVRAVRHPGLADDPRAAPSPGGRCGDSASWSASPSRTGLTPSASSPPAASSRPRRASAASTPRPNAGCGGATRCPRGSSASRSAASRWKRCGRRWRGR